MSTKKFCPYCDETTDVTSKGKDKQGRQRWYCKTCGKSFTEGIDYSDVIPEKTPKKDTSKKEPKTTTKIVNTAKKEPEPKTTKKEKVEKTIISLNKNHIIELPNNMTREDAFNAIRNSHRGISLDKCNENVSQGVKTINFRSTGGTKG